MKSNILQKIENYFDFVSHKTSFRTEILGGVSTFLALSYIFVVNPAILSEGGMDKSAVFFATVLASFIATLAMGMWAKKPFVLAPGMEMNAYVAFFVIAGLGFTWQQALGAVFWSGVIYMVLTFTRVRAKIIDAIPDKIKSTLSLCVGVFLMLIALRIAGMINYEGIAFSGPGTLFSPLVFLMLFGLTVIILLRKLGAPGSIVISIIIVSATAHFIGLGAQAESITVSEDMLSGVMQLDLGVILNPAIFSVILVLFLVDFYGSVAKFIGLSRNTNIVDKNGKMPRMKEALSVDGSANMLGAVLGTTSIITYVESRIGIQEGARTGFAALVCAILMLSMFFIAPAVNLVPLIATTGALLWVGISLFPTRSELRQYSRVELVTVVVMVISVIATFAIDKALLFGFIVYIAGMLLAGRRKEISMYMVISTVLLSIGVVLAVIGA